MIIVIGLKIVPFWRGHPVNTNPSNLDRERWWWGSFLNQRSAKADASSLVSCDLVLRLAHPVAQKVGFYEATNSVSPLLLQAQPRRGERAQASYTALNENLTEYAGGS